MQVESGFLGEVLQLGVPGILAAGLYFLWRYHEKQMARKDQEIDDYRKRLQEEQLNFVAMLREQLTSYGVVISKMSSLPDDVAIKLVDNISNMQSALHGRIEELPVRNLEKMAPHVTKEVQAVKDILQTSKNG